MSHMVIYRGTDGKPGYHQTDEIIDAVQFVEKLRNEQSVEHARIFRLEEVQFEFRPYFRVELTGSSLSLGSGSSERGLLGASTAPESSTGGAGRAEPPAAESAVESVPGTVTVGAASEQPSGDDSTLGARRGLFGR
jgi:hypothetical protein